MRTSRAVRSAIPFVISTLSLLGATGARAPEEGAAPGPPPAEEKPAKETPPPPDTSAEEPPPTEKPPSTEIAIGEFHGWKLSVEARLNSFIIYGWGNQLVQNDP